MEAASRGISRTEATSTMRDLGPTRGGLQGSYTPRSLLCRAHDFERGTSQGRPSRKGRSPKPFCDLEIPKVCVLSGEMMPWRRRNQHMCGGRVTSDFVPTDVANRTACYLEDLRLSPRWMPLANYKIRSGGYAFTT